MEGARVALSQSEGSGLAISFFITKTVWPALGTSESCSNEKHEENPSERMHSLLRRKEGKPIGIICDYTNINSEVDIESAVQH